METPLRKRQFSLRLIFSVMTVAAILCAVWSFADRFLSEKALHDKERREQSRRQHDRALADWEKHEDPSSWDFGP